LKEYYLLESNAFGVESNLAVLYYNPKITAGITEDKIMDMFYGYFGLMGIHYILDRIWEK